jgi:hypothetical protein
MQVRAFINIFWTLIFFFSAWITHAHSFYLDEFSDQFDWTKANTSVWLSAAAYYPSYTLLSRTYLGYSTGFVSKFLVYNGEYDILVGFCAPWK